MVITCGEELVGAARAAVERIIAEIDAACSRFREDSELMALNRSGGRPTRVSPLLFDAVQAAVRAAALTDGDVDPTLGEALIALGYDRDFTCGLDDPCAASGDTTGGHRRLRLASVPGWRTIGLDRDAGTVWFGRGVSLDLGATAKALAADRAAAAASRAIGGGGVLVGLGGDIATAGLAPGGGWWVRVTDDHRASVDAPGQWITLAGGGLATSSTVVRRWRRGRRTVHHLLDPATGRPAEGGWRTASVTAASCLDANIASTAAIVRGPRAPEWLQSLGLPSRLVSDAGVALHIAGWPATGDDLLSHPATAIA
ncbi:MAG: FAD:protein FMN transferase [Solirubrobacteraceae bacterium]